MGGVEGGRVEALEGWLEGVEGWIGGGDGGGGGGEGLVRKMPSSTNALNAQRTHHPVRRSLQGIWQGIAGLQLATASPGSTYSLQYSLQLTVQDFK